MSLLEEIVARANALIRRNQIYQKPGQVAESLDHYSFDGLEILSLDTNHRRPPEIENEFLC